MAAEVEETARKGSFLLNHCQKLKHCHSPYRTLITQRVYMEESERAACRTAAFGLIIPRILPRLRRNTRVCSHWLTSNKSSSYPSSFEFLIPYVNDERHREFNLKTTHSIASHHNSHFGYAGRPRLGSQTNRTAPYRELEKVCDAIDYPLARGRSHEYYSRYMEWINNVEPLY